MRKRPRPPIIGLNWWRVAGALICLASAISMVALIAWIASL